MNLILHGIRGKIEIGNSLLNDRHPSLKADIVIANRPFNQQKWGWLAEREQLAAYNQTLRVSRLEPATR